MTKYGLSTPSKENLTPLVKTTAMAVLVMISFMAQTLVMRSLETIKISHLSRVQ